MNRSRSRGKVPSTKVLPESISLQSEIGLARSRRRLQTKKPTRQPIRERSPDQTEQATLWDVSETGLAKSPSTPIQTKKLTEQSIQERSPDHTEQAILWDVSETGLAKSQSIMIQTKKVTEQSIREASHDHTEQTLFWNSDTPGTPVSSLPLTVSTTNSVKLEKKLVGKDKGVVEALMKYFSWAERTKSLTRWPKIWFTLFYLFLVAAIFGGLFCSHLSSLLLLVNQNKFSNAYQSSYTVLESFASSEEIRVSRDDCPLVSSRDIRIFLNMNDRFPQIIAIASCAISISLGVIILLSKGSAKTKKMTYFFLKLIAITVSILCLCKIALIVTLFYFPMHSFTQLLENFLFLRDNRCFTTPQGEAVTNSLIELEDQFNALKVWMWVELGSISGIMLFPCIKCLESWFLRQKKMKKSL